MNAEAAPERRAGAGEVVLEVEDLVVEFRPQRSLADLVARRSARRLRAVDGVSFAILRDETLGLVGESGSGKTTLGRALLRLHEPTAGRITFEGASLNAKRGRELRALRRHMQMVFQDPYSSLNPRMTVGQAVAEVLRVHRVCPRAEVAAEVAQLLGLVGLSAELAGRFPGALSGGQRQRVGLARALAVRPRFLVLDEPVAALDVSIQAQVLNLLGDLRARFGLSMLFVAHELSVVRQMSNRVAVMYLGRIVEIGGVDEIFGRPSHPYTQGLLRAAPRLVPERRRRRAVLEGDVPSPLEIPSGCRFHTRCPHAEPICREAEPPVRTVAPGQHSACHFAEAIRARWTGP